MSDKDRIRELESIVRDTLWMACRYAHGRQSYAVGMYNGAARKAEALGLVADKPAEPIFAMDYGLTPEMAGLSPEENERAFKAWSCDHAIRNHCQPDFFGSARP